PWDFTDFADTTHTYLQQLEQLDKHTAAAPALSFAPLSQAQNRLRFAAAGYHRAYATAAASGSLFNAPQAQLAALNRLLYQSERKMMIAGGLPGRPWYRDAIYAPGTYTGYGVKTMPGVREAIEQQRWDLAQRQIQADAGVLDAVSAQIEAATGRLGIRY
ncbi:MAG: transferrin receptor-like dimerization domain-containing protein, partial [Terriglobales bacterium]